MADASPPTSAAVPAADPAAARRVPPPRWSILVGVVVGIAATGRGLLAEDRDHAYSAEDLALLLRAMLSEDAPGMDAVRPIASAGGDQRIGLGWLIDDDGTIWHNGRTGGFSAWVGLQPASQRAAVVLARTDASVDAVGWALLDNRSASDTTAVDPPPARPGLFDLGLFVIVIPLWLAAQTVLLAWRGRGDSRPLDRIDVLGLAVTALAMLALSRTLGAWQVAPLGWVAVVGVTGGALGSLLVRLPTLPATAGPGTRRRWTTAALNVVAMAALLLLVWWP